MSSRASARHWRTRRGPPPRRPRPSAAPPTSDTETDSGSNGSASSDGGAADGRGGERLPTVRNRDDALHAITLLADYFRRNEPHSLIPFALEQAVRWGRMSIPELFAELIPDDNPRE